MAKWYQYNSDKLVSKYCKIFLSQLWAFDQFELFNICEVIMANVVHALQTRDTERCFTPALKYYIRGFSNKSDVALQQEREVRFRFMPDASGRRLLWRHLKEATVHSGGFHTGSSTTFANVQLISQKQRQRRPWATDHSGGSHRILFQPIWQIFNFFSHKYWAIILK